MPAARLSYVPWFPHDWLLDARVGMLTPEERAYYFDLLMHCYISADGTIPGDIPTLQHLARARPEADLKHCLALFERTENGRFRHARVDIEIKRIWKAHEAKARAGSKGGKRKGANIYKQTSSTPQAELEQAASSAKLSDQIRPDQIRSDQKDQKTQALRPGPGGEHTPPGIVDNSAGAGQNPESLLTQLEQDKTPETAPDEHARPKPSPNGSTRPESRTKEKTPEIAPVERTGPSDPGGLGELIDRARKCQSEWFATDPTAEILAQKIDPGRAQSAGPEN